MARNLDVFRVSLPVGWTLFRKLISSRSAGRRPLRGGPQRGGVRAVYMFAEDRRCRPRAEDPMDWYLEGPHVDRTWEVQKPRGRGGAHAQTPAVWTEAIEGGACVGVGEDGDASETLLKVRVLVRVVAHRIEIGVVGATQRRACDTRS